MSTERNILIHNPHSTEAVRVGQLITHLDESGVRYEAHTTPSPKAADNIDWTAELVRPGDRIFSAAGDGTASQVGEGILRADAPNIELGLGAYGGFNDGPASLGPVDPVKFFEGRVATRELRSIEVDRDGEQHMALLYTTLGWTAGFAEKFMTSNREAMQHTRSKTARQFGSAATYFLGHGRDKLPAYTVNDEDKVHTRESDVLARNSPVMAKMVRGTDYMSESQFGFHQLQVANLLRDIPYAYESVLRGRTPSTSVERVALKFIDPASFYLMRDGESELVHDVKSLILSKRTDGPSLRVATTRST